MKLFNTLVVALILVLGCVSVPPKDAEWIATHMSVSKVDPYKGTGPTLWTPDVEKPYGSAGDGFWIANLSWTTGRVGLYVEWSNGDWAFFDHAAIATGKRLPLRVIDRKITPGGRIEEKVRVTLSPAFLVAHREGFNVKIWGSHGEILVEIPSIHVQGLLLRVARDRASARGNSRPLPSSASR